MTDIDLLTVERGMVIAPAGCGKTQLIVEALRRNNSDKPVLVLTHTNAGVAALRQRLAKEKLPAGGYKLATIDGWALRLVSTFPERSGYDGGANPKKPNYLKIRKAAWGLLKANHITDVLKASYSHILVDEYQDCSHNQHAILFYAAKHLPCCVLADQMQAIFGFGNDPLADWDKHVSKHFPKISELDEPWRWKNAGNEELGQWLLSVRKTLLVGGEVDLDTAPKSVKWVELDGDDDHSKLVAAARCAHKNKGETSLVIGDSMSASSRYKVAKSVPGIVAVEPVDLKDLTAFAGNLDLFDGYSVGETLDFAESLITNIGSDGIQKRMKSIKNGKSRTEPSDLELLALEVENAPTFSGLARILSCCSAQSGSRCYRPGVLRASLRALSLVQSNPDLSFIDAAVQVREESRAVGRQLPLAAIGSTLLLKGLEADHVVVLNADKLDGRNLYVAMTRGAKTITVCSKNSLLKP
ncbi:UvrD-helicase domain-containing protein [uncultured Ruegeria sp.]|uniref:UvrD-helicase domain-containing protein n=1 Tax=uncultured Ruegeria sp. TaxID=259304 RepID=UPI00260ED1CF|nr:UvrD-helicase domain-containing protein [uncultured Ruegeria sp.]